MYYPFLRGKQNELLAVRELSQSILLNSPNISPIFEPVKFSSTFNNTFPEYAKRGINFSLIINPRKGQLKSKSQDLIDFCSNKLENYNNYQLGIIIDNKTSLTNIIESISKSKASKKLTLIHNQSDDQIEEKLNELARNFSIVNNVVNLDNIRERYFTNFDSTSIISMNDNFSSQSKNADYLEVGESDFSDEHRHFENEGIKGFSDYLTLGDKYSESGFSPYAVAIHITFIENNTLRVKHFVSDDNLDNTNIAAKYFEALTKLIEWDNTHNLDTIAMRKFHNYYDRQHFPNLGILKKLSIMNHLEIVNRIL